MSEEKIDELRQKATATKSGRTRNMYERNIEILEKYKGIPLKRLCPNGKLDFLKRSDANSILAIKGLEIEVKPNSGS